ncbi:hypothetical protein HanIR_Chr15g0740081 [Helianthus annuus]|nr:hypothetical protein HanIR_Chr15g0740081 [Helianthus annuus]
MSSWCDGGDPVTAPSLSFSSRGSLSLSLSFEAFKEVQKWKTHVSNMDDRPNKSIGTNHVQKPLFISMLN